MLIDITLTVTPQMVSTAPGKEDRALVGHLGTHFDVMNQVFPLEYTRRRAVIFDVSGITERDIDLCDIDITRVEQDMFVAFFTGYIEQEPYGTKAYFSQHPQLSHSLIDALLDKDVSIIGIDCSGIRRGKEHTPKDQVCADRGTFVVENLCNLRSVAELGSAFTAHTYPMNYTGMTGLPCRVVAEV